MEEKKNLKCQLKAEVEDVKTSKDLVLNIFIFTVAETPR